MKTQRIHFVCTGNTFRSRLAEALLKSKEIPGIEVSSSGIDAKAAYDGPITWYGSRLAYRYGLIPYLKPYWTQTTKEDIRNADLLVFMNQKQCQYCINHLDLNSKSYEVWDIPDINDVLPTESTYSHKDDLGYIDASERSFAMLTQKVDELEKRLRSGMK